MLMRDLCIWERWELSLVDHFTWLKISNVYINAKNQCIRQRWELSIRQPFPQDSGFPMQLLHVLCHSIACSLPGMKEMTVSSLGRIGVVSMREKRNKKQYQQLQLHEFRVLPWCPPLKKIIKDWALRSQNRGWQRDTKAISQTENWNTSETLTKCIDNEHSNES